MAIWYRASFGKINEIDVIRDTESSVWVTDFRGKPRRSAKHSSYESFFPSFDEAKAHIVGRAVRTLAHARSAVSRAEGELAKAEALEPPK